MKRPPHGLPPEYKALLRRLGLRPEPEASRVLRQALTHRSFAIERGSTEDNERLELLGDAVISVLVTELLMEQHRDWDEGQLSKARAAAVSRRVLAVLAERLGLGPLLRLGQGEEAQGGRCRASILGSALEAVCGALYLAYPYITLRRALRGTVAGPVIALADSLRVEDFKSRLQEWCQARGLALPVYTLEESRGPDHDLTFVVSCTINGHPVGRGEGRRIALAQQAAAEAVLEAPPDPTLLEAPGPGPWPAKPPA